MVSNLWKMAEKFAYMIKKQYLCTAFIIIGASLYAAGTQQQSIIRPYSVAVLRNIHRSPSGTPIMLKAAQYGDRFYIVACNLKNYSIMTNAAIEGIQNPLQEISSKLTSYFRNHGFKHEGQFDKTAPLDGDFAFELFGTMDDVQVQVVYEDYKPKKAVIRDILALDDRISNVDVYRCLSDANYREELSRISLDPIYVLIDGKLMETNIFDYVQYGARNIDYTRK